MATLGRVLVVDDDRDIVASVSMRLNAAGYETRAAFDGQEGVALATSSMPDAIVLDVRMPKMDGMTALATLKRQPATRHIPIVILSASLQDEQAALLAGASFFVLKPYAPKYLLAALDSAIRSATPAAIDAAPEHEISSTVIVGCHDSGFVACDDSNKRTS